MRLVLDTNEFVASLGAIKHPASERLLNLIIELYPKHTTHIPRTIINETRRNLPPKVFSEFIRTIQIIASIDEDILVPFEIGMKYEAMGLKDADAFIAAYAEWVSADALVSENRHFLARSTNLPFKVLNAEHCLKLLTK